MFNFAKSALLVDLKPLLGDYYIGLLNSRLIIAFFGCLFFSTSWNADGIARFYKGG